MTTKPRSAGSGAWHIQQLRAYIIAMQITEAEHMMNDSVYQDIARRTGGDVYVGVVGPVRTGKSTFIKRFMESLVIPNIDDVYRRERAKDELPQSGSGRTIMTAEPTFVPEEAVQIQVGEDVSCSVRLIDSVGYMVDGALGSDENGLERMVTTPWFDEEVPMRVAAEEGTRKVISEHSTIGIVITTDGTITELPREAYLEAEGRVIRELQSLGKPFVVLVNSMQPKNPETQGVCRDLADTYGVTCLPVNCLELSEEEIAGIIHAVLEAFPVTHFGIFLPSWVEALDLEHPLKKELYADVLRCGEAVRTLRDVKCGLSVMEECDNIVNTEIMRADPGTGCVDVALDVPRKIFYQILTENSGFEINSDGDLMSLVSGLKDTKGEYERVAEAIRDVRQYGYGIVLPSREELSLAEPEIVRQGGRYGVKLKASAPSIHMIAVDVVTEVNPGIGGERSSEDVVNFLLQEFEGDVGKIWDSNIFGKSLNDLAGESLHTKLRNMPAEAREKIKDTLGRIVNENSNGLICILL